MHFVDDEDALPIANGRDRQSADDDFTDVVDARVRGGVDLEHVHVAALRDLDAGVTDPARIRRGTLDAVERPRQQARSRRLADAAWSGEDERLMDTSAGNGVPQRTRHGLLADDIIEALWTPLAGKDLIHGREAMTNVD